LGGKGGQCVGLHLHVPIVLKSGSLNILEPSGPVQACTGSALPLSFTYVIEQMLKVLPWEQNSLFFLELSIDFMLPAIKFT
jgi:hypothetical protein